MWVKPSEGQLANVVVTAAWRCDGEQISDGITYTGTCFSTASVVAPDPSSFIPYPNLTEDEVLQWVWNSGVDKVAVEASVQRQIDDKINPPVITPNLPW